MTPEQAFLADMRDNFEDDTPRLIYADWLDDHGEPERAEFIRLQCKLARIRETDPGRPALEEREKELLLAQESAWLGRLLGRLNKWEFRRGFIDTVVVRPNVLLEMGGELGQRAPLCKVILDGSYGNRDLTMLLNQAEVGWLTRLGLDSSVVTSPGLSTLAETDRLPLLSELSVSHFATGGHWVSTLALSPERSSLRRLDLNYPRGSTVVARALVDPRCRLNLQGLNLLGNRLGDEGATALSNAPHMRSLTDLSLWAEGIGDAGALTVVTSPYLAGLTRLNLNANNLSIAGIKAVLQAPNVQNLRYLSLGCNELGRRGAALLAGLEPLPALTELDLWGSDLGDDEAALLADSPFFSRLTFLGLRFNYLTDKGSQALLDSPYLSRLESIELFGSDNKLGPTQKCCWRNRLGKAARL